MTGGPRVEIAGENEDECEGKSGSKTMKIFHDADGADSRGTWQSKAPETSWARCAGVNEGQAQAALRDDG